MDRAPGRAARRTRLSSALIRGKDFYWRRARGIADEKPRRECVRQQAADKLPEHEQRHVAMRMPANVLDSARAIVIAGFAKLVDAVNQ